MRIFSCDFETTVDNDTKQQTSTEVWSAAIAELYSDFVTVYNNIHDFIKFFHNLCEEKVIVYFHNVKFDGNFLLNTLMENGYKFHHREKPYEKLYKGEFDAIISGQNRWYSITVCTGRTVIEIRDSAKLMPMTLARMGKAFNTKHRKLEMEYKGERHAGGLIKPEEMQYIINDVLVLKEALEFMLDSGNTRLTIGSNCIAEYKKCFDKEQWNAMYPDLKAFVLDESVYKYPNADAYIRRSYRGGWCYCNPKYMNKWIDTDGMTYDVNSLYPSVMHSKSGNIYPVGKPTFWTGNKIPEEALQENRVFFVRLKARFTIKPNHLPSMQIKDSLMYKSTEWLTSSDVQFGGKKYAYYYDADGILQLAYAEFTLTSLDYKLFLEHYDIHEIEILSGCYFNAVAGLFDEYIDKYMTMKMNSEGGAREEAKLFLNNCYGKLATNDDSSYQEPYLDEDGLLRFILHEEHNKKTLSIAQGSFVTSYARYFTITHAQANYDNFIYADTDSLHMFKCEPNKIVEHSSKLLCWKLESEWSRAKFIRQKTYCEFIRKENHKKVTSHWDIKCAGMQDRTKQYLLATRPISCFDYGLTLNSQLKQKQVKGGILLVDADFTLYKQKAYKPPKSFGKVLDKIQ